MCTMHPTAIKNARASLKWFHIGHEVMDSEEERDSGFASDLEWIWAEHLLCHSNGEKALVSSSNLCIHIVRVFFRIALDVLLHFSHNKEFSVNFVVTMTIAAAVATPLLLRLLLMLHVFFCTLLVSIFPIVPFRSHWTFHMVKVCVYVF